MDEIHRQGGYFAGAAICRLATMDNSPSLQGASGLFQGSIWSFVNLWSK